MEFVRNIKFYINQNPPQSPPIHNQQVNWFGTHLNSVSHKCTVSFLTLMYPCFNVKGGKFETMIVQFNVSIQIFYGLGERHRMSWKQGILCKLWNFQPIPQDAHMMARERCGLNLHLTAQYSCTQGSAGYFDYKWFALSLTILFLAVPLRRLGPAIAADHHHTSPVHASTSLLPERLTESAHEGEEGVSGASLNGY